MTLFENEVGMEPGDVLLRQLKAKFPPKKKVSSKGKEKKVKKMKKKLTQPDSGFSIFTLETLSMSE